VRFPDPGNGRSPSAARCDESAASTVGRLTQAGELKWKYVANFL
jgi:hypothetical protein